MSKSSALVPRRVRSAVSVRPQLPSLYTADEHTAKRTFEFFTANIRNPPTRKAYSRPAAEFASWCELNGIGELQQVQPVHVAAYVEGLRLAAPSIKLRLAALRMLFDWLVVGQVLPSNPASSVRGPKHSAKKGRTAVVTAEEARAILDRIDIDTVVGLRDRALIALMVFTFARVGAVIKMRVEDVYVQSRRTWVRLHEKGGKRHVMPAHHNLEAYLQAYLDGASLTEAKSILFRTAAGRTGNLTSRPMSQADVYRMIGRRARDAGVRTKIGCHSFRATGITEYLRNSGKLEVAQQMANHESARTTSLYDRRDDQVSLDEVERILI